MNIKRVISLGLTLAMLTTCVGCGATGASTAVPAEGATAEAAAVEEAPAE
jgi:predicted small lipoprotein YifL